MAKDKINERDAAERTTPKTGAEEQATDKERSIEVPADTPPQTSNLQKRAEAANKTANQTIDDGNEHEVQGKLAVPTTKVMKRGSTKWTDENGNVVKKLNDAEPDTPIGKEQVPQYIKLHQAVLDGADPLETTLDYQDKKPEEAFQEGKLADAEKYPRTGGIGVAAATPENQQRADEENK